MSYLRLFLALPVRMPYLCLFQTSSEQQSYVTVLERCSPIPLKRHFVFRLEEEQTSIALHLLQRDQQTSQPQPVGSVRINPGQC